MNNNSILWFMDCKFFEYRAPIDGRMEEFSIFGRFALYSYAIGDFIDSIDLWFLNCADVDDMLTAFCYLPSLHVIQLVFGFVVGRGKSNFVRFALFLRVYCCCLRFAHSCALDPAAAVDSLCSATICAQVCDWTLLVRMDSMLAIV